MTMRFRQWAFVTFALLLSSHSSWAEPTLSPDTETQVIESTTQAATEQADLQYHAEKLITAKFREKAAIISDMAALGDSNALPLFQAMLDGKLFYHKKDKYLLFKTDADPIQVFGGEPVSGLGKRDTKKVGVNNSLRRVLRAEIARMQLFSDDKGVRKEAAINLLKSAKDLDPELLTSALEQEAEADIVEILSLVQGLAKLESDNKSERLEAVEALSGSLYSEVRGALTNFIESANNNSRTDEADAAQAALDEIQTLLRVNSVFENLYFGLALGAVLLLAAIGLAITFGVMGVINMAHGEMIMLGAYTTYVVQQLMPDHIGASLIISIPAAFLVTGLVGVAIERGVIRHLYGRPLETLLATFGLSLILQQAVRSVFSPLNREVASPDWMSGTFMINPALELTYNRLYIIIFSLLVLGALALVLKRTLFGLQMRAVTMNRPMASSMGIRTGWVDALTFGLGSGIAGIAGVALSQLTNVGPNMGQAYIIDSFMVVVFGGVGNLWGTLVGAMSLGVVNKLLEPWAGAVIAKILVLVFIILFIQKRPRGLFALKGRAADMG